MNHISISELNEKSFERVLKELKDEKPVAVTEGGKPQAVLVSPEAYQVISNELDDYRLLSEEIAEASKRTQRRKIV